jgi:hypothetical protein
MASCTIEMDLARLGNCHLKASQHDLDGVYSRVIAETKQRKPVRLDLLAKFERGNLDLDGLALQLPGHTMEKLLQLALANFMAHSDHLLGNRGHGR